MRARETFINKLAELLNSPNIDFENLGNCIQTFFSELDQAAKFINGNNYLRQRLGLEATEEIAEEIKNLFYLDPNNEDEQKLIQALGKLRENLSQQSTPVHSEIFDYITLFLSRSNEKNSITYFETRLAQAQNIQDIQKNIQAIQGIINDISDLANKISPRSNNEQLKADMHALRDRYYEIIDRATLKAYGGENGKRLMNDFNARLEGANNIKEIKDLINEILNLITNIFPRSNNEQLKADMHALRYRYYEIIDRARLIILLKSNLS